VAPGRNQPCPCGSGKKYKHCCGGASAKPSALKPRKPLYIAIGIVLVLASVVSALVGLRQGLLLLIVGAIGVAIYWFVHDPPPSSGRGGSDGINFGRR